MANREISYKRMDGVDASHGQKFEMDMTTLVYLRCQSLHEKWKREGTGIKTFAVANNVEGAGKFDDIVVRLEYVAEGVVKNKLIFVQCKHLQNPSEQNYKTKFQSYLSVGETLTDYLQSYKTIEESRENEIKERFRIKTSDNEQQLRVQQDKNKENKLKSFFDCENLEIELVFYSNINNDTDCNLYNTKERNRNHSDPTHDIFNTANGEQCELQLIEHSFLELKFKNQKNISLDSKRKFCEKFRVFVAQSEPEIFISKELKLQNNNIVDVESLRDLVVQEVSSNFKAQTQCNALTEKDDLLQNVHNFWDIRRKGLEECDAFRKNFGITNIFLKQTVENFARRFETVNQIIIDTNHPELEKLKVLQFAHTTFVETTFLFLKDKDDEIKWKSSRKTKSYKNLSRIYISSNYILNLGTETLIPNEFLVQFKERSEQKLPLAEYLEQFSSETEQFICKTKVCFQGENTDIKSLCGDIWKWVFDERSIYDILVNNLLQISTPLPILDFYIKRNFTKEILNLEYFLGRKKTLKISGDCIILFSEGIKCIPDHETDYKVFFDIKEVRTFVQKLVVKANGEGSYHLISYTNDQLHWIYSFGRKSGFTSEKIIGEDDLINETKAKISILSDVAGMGKTSTLLSLARKYKENNPSHWVSFFELNKYLQSFGKIHEFASTEFAVQFIGKTLLNLEANEFLLFTKSCESGNSALFFDAFDEISPDAEKSFPLLLLALEKTRIRYIVVSSRPNFATSLENKLLCKSIKFQGLETKEKEFALEGYWKQMLKTDEKRIEDNILRKVAVETVKLLQLKEEFLSEILAIPLQIRMIAIVYYEFLLNINPEKLVPNLSTLNLADLYKQFINLHAERFNVDKYKMEWNNIKIDQKKRFIQHKLKGSEEIACRIIIPELLRNDIINREDEISALCHDVGIITHKSPVVFLHRTVAEYLAAKYLVRKVFCERNCDYKRIVTNILVKSEFNIVRKFINSQLIKTTADIFGHYQTKNLYFCKEESPIYVSAMEGNVEILRQLARNNALLNFRNIYGQTALHTACKYGHTEAAKLLLSIRYCSVNIRDNDHDTGLHAAARKGDIEVMQLILQRYRTLLNMQNKSGFTPLHEACYRGENQAVKLLLSHKDCSVNICDNDGDTILHVATRRENTDIMQLILKRDSSLLNKQNVSGFTPLKTACSNNKTEAMKLLLASTKMLETCDYNGGQSLTVTSFMSQPLVLNAAKKKDLTIETSYANAERNVLLIIYTKMFEDEWNQLGKSLHQHFWIESIFVNDIDDIAHLPRASRNINFENCGSLTVIVLAEIFKTKNCDFCEKLNLRHSRIFTHLSDVWSQFTSSQCCDLRGKPCMFFFCDILQSNLLEFEDSHKKQGLQIDENIAPVTEHINNLSDFLWAYCSGKDMFEEMKIALLNSHEEITKLLTTAMSRSNKSTCGTEEKMSFFESTLRLEFYYRPPPLERGKLPNVQEATPGGIQIEPVANSSGLSNFSVTKGSNEEPLQLPSDAQEGRKLEEEFKDDLQYTKPKKHLKVIHEYNLAAPIDDHKNCSGKCLEDITKFLVIPKDAKTKILGTKIVTIEPNEYRAIREKTTYESLPQEPSPNILGISHFLYKANIKCYVFVYDVGCEVVELPEYVSTASLEDRKSLITQVIHLLQYFHRHHILYGLFIPNSMYVAVNDGKPQLKVGSFQQIVVCSERDEVTDLNTPDEKTSTMLEDLDDAASTIAFIYHKGETSKIEDTAEQIQKEMHPMALVIETMDTEVIVNKIWSKLNT